VYTGEASLYTLTLNTYDIQASANGSGLPALYRNNQELVEGIENIQVLYGEDNNNDNTADSYVPAGTAGLTMDNVVSIRISLVAFTIDDNVATQAIPYTLFGDTVTPAAPPLGDRRIRRVFTSTIALRNRLP
jgi:type IV pilus assembly protein PilW